MRDRAKYSPFYLDIYVVIFYTVVQSDNNYFLDNMKIEPKIIAEERLTDKEFDNSSAEKRAKQTVTCCRPEDSVRENGC